MSKQDEKLLLTPKEIEGWLYNRLGSGNVFEQFNRGFCEDLAKTQLAKVADKMNWQHGKDFVTLTELMKLVSNLKQALKGD